MAKKKAEPTEDSPVPEPVDPGTSAPADTVRKRKKKGDKDEGIKDEGIKAEGIKAEGIEMVEEQPPPPETQFKGTKKAPTLLTTREIGNRYLDRESYLKLCIREMLVYAVFLIVVGILAAGQRSSSEYYLSRVMTKLFVETKFKTITTAEVINYNDINTLEQIWEYFNHYLLNTYWDFWYSHSDKIDNTEGEEKSIFFENKIIGTPRVRQLRVKNDSCVVPDDFKLMFSHCYAEYSSSSEDKETYGPGNSTAWSYASPGDLGSLSVSGEISTYYGGGFYFDLAKDIDTTNNTIRELFNNLWLDRGSRALILQFTTYNANENLFFTLTLLLELPPTGGVLPSYIIHVEKFLNRDIWDFVILGFTLVFILFVLLYTIEEIYEIAYFRWHYLDSFWNFMDLLILIFSYISIGLFVFSYLKVKGQIQELVDTEKEHACFDKVNSARDSYLTFLAILFFFAAIKLLKYMNFNHSMYQMQTTLSRATKDIACFSIIFFIVFITFAQLGHLLFGSQVRDFRSFVHSVFALLRTAVGDFDYHKIENVNHFLGPVYFFAYIFFIYFILVNMFLAIIIDTYSEVRTTIRDQSKELQVGDIICRWFRKILRCCGCRKMAEKHDRPLPTGDGTTAYDDIQNLLRRCGFTDMEIDLFFAKFDIPRDRQISQDEMRSKLLSNFNMQPETDKAKTAAEGQERDELGEKLMGRIRVLEDNITDVNYKIDLIDNKIDAIQQIRARKRTLAQDQT